MIINEAIQALEFNKAVILFNPTTEKPLEPEQLNKNNRKAYEALEMAIEALEEKKTRVRCCSCKHWKVSSNDYSNGFCKHDEEFGILIERYADSNCDNWEKKAGRKKK